MHCPAIEAGAAICLSCVAAERAVGDRDRGGGSSGVLDTASSASCVSAKSAVNDAQRSAVVDAASRARDTARRVGANGTVNDGHCSKAVYAATLDRWVADRARRVAAESAVGDRQRPGIVGDAAAGAGDRRVAAERNGLSG